MMEIHQVEKKNKMEKHQHVDKSWKRIIKAYKRWKPPILRTILLRQVRKKRSDG